MSTASNYARNLTKSYICAKQLCCRTILVAGSGTEILKNV